MNSSRFQYRSLAITDTYANRGLNAPTLSGASGGGSGGHVTGQIASRNGEFIVQIFRNTSCDASGRGEGATVVANEAFTISNQTPGANGTATFDIALPSNLNFEGTTLTAFLLDADGNNSEFSACRAYEALLCRELFKDGLEDNPAPPACTPL